MDFEQFKAQMLNQALPLGMAKFLIWVLPALEILVSALLIFKRTVFFGLIASFVLMACFTGYVGLVLTGYPGRMPCSCGGVIRALGWKLHFLFNVFFLLLSSAGIYLVNRERRKSQ